MYTISVCSFAILLVKVRVKVCSLSIFVGYVKSFNMFQTIWNNTWQQAQEGNFKFHKQMEATRKIVVYLGNLPLDSKR